MTSSNNDHLPTTTTIFVSHCPSNRMKVQRPPVISGHYFGVPRVVVAHRFLQMCWNNKLKRIFWGHTFKQLPFFTILLSFLEIDDVKFFNFFSTLALGKKLSILLNMIIFFIWIFFWLWHFPLPHFWIRKKII